MLRERNLDEYVNCAFLFISKRTQQKWEGEKTEVKKAPDHSDVDITPAL